MTVKHDFPFQDTCVGKGSAILVMLNQFDWKKTYIWKDDFHALGIYSQDITKGGAEDVRRRRPAGTLQKMRTSR